MCAIAGIVSLKGRAVDPLDVVQMCRVQEHRGPDDGGAVLLAPMRKNQNHGWWEIPLDGSVQSGQTNNDPGLPARTTQHAFQVGLGHRRLAILDLSSAGHQPMANRDGSIWLVYNGEIYNYPELKKDLMGRGYEFLSQTDSEVLLHLYEAHGTACVEYLNGMFAFAVWDARARLLYLARDRYGIKPLYYACTPDALVFASEVKALLGLGWMPRGIDYPALLDYFTFQNTFGESTLFEGIHLLEPGHSMTVKNGRVQRNRYWDFQFQPFADAHETSMGERLRGLLEESVTRHLMSDVPVGAYLSGGMDSGTLTALASRVVPRLATFTGGFDMTDVSGFEAGFDERKDAERMSALFKTEHYQMVFHAGDLEWALPRVIRAVEDLRVGMCYPYYYTARLASRFVKVVLAGTGGDEIFAGYPWRYRVLSDVRSHEEFMSRYYAYWTRLVPAKDRACCFTPDVLRQLRGHDPFETFRGVADHARTLDNPVRKGLYFEAKTFLHGLLVVEDKLSMAHSLESRVPLLDHALVDFVTKLPTNLLINHQWEKNPDRDGNLAGKYLFRRAMEGVLPDSILTKRKQGFSPPEQCWYQGPLLAFIRDTLLAPRARARGIFQEAYVRKVLEEHTTGQANHRLLIWSWLSFEWWSRLFLDGEVLANARTGDPQEDHVSHSNVGGRWVEATS